MIVPEHSTTVYWHTLGNRLDAKFDEVKHIEMRIVIWSGGIRRRDLATQARLYVEQSVQDDTTAGLERMQLYQLNRTMNFLPPEHSPYLKAH